MSKPKKGVTHEGFDHDGVDTYVCLACGNRFYATGELDYNLCPYCGQNIKPIVKHLEKAKERHALRDRASRRGSARYTFWALQLRRKGEDWDRWLDPCGTNAKAAKAQFNKECRRVERQQAMRDAGERMLYERVNDGVRLVYGSGIRDYKVAKEFTLPV